MCITTWNPCGRAQEAPPGLEGVGRAVGIIPGGAAEDERDVSGAGLFLPCLCRRYRWAPHLEC